MVDGYLNFNTQVDTSGFDKGTKKISGKASKLGGMFSGVMGTALGVGVAQVASKVVSSLANVATQAIELASDMDEVQNVVDTSFGDMAYKCEEFANIAIDQFGMSKLSAKQTASTYMSMAKSMGLSMESASNMAIETAKLTGDVASFYNISTDLASTKLKSIFTGETETLKDLGVVMTEVNLKQYALANGYKTAYSDMSQAEKVALRYNFVMDALADSQGDFAKTSGSWANQTRILQERWKELLSILGSGLIKVFTPVIQVINQVLSALITLANAFANTMGKLFGFTKEVKATTKSAATAAKAETNLAEGVSEAGEAASSSLASFDKLDVLQSDTASSASGSSSGGGGGIADTMLDFSDVESPKADTSVFDDLSESIQRLQPYADALKSAWDNLKDAFERFGNSKGVQAVLNFFKDEIWENRLLPSFLLTWTGLFDTLAGVIDVVSGALTWLVGIITGDFEMANEGMAQIGLGLQEIWKGVGEVLEGVLIGILGKDCVEAIGAFIEKAAEWFTSTDVYTTGIRDIFGGLLDFIAGIFTGDWEKAWNGILRFSAGIGNTIISIAESAVNFLIKAVNWCIDQLNKIHIDVPDWVEDLTGMTGFGFNIPNLSEVKLSRISVPKLASGAVIPPNGEFLAMLGDQRSGNNLEAPESLIRQIVREESGGGNIVINAKGTMGQLIRLLKLEVDRESNRSGKSFAKGGAY